MYIYVYIFVQFDNPQPAQDALECLQMASSKQTVRQLLSFEQDYDEYEQFLQQQQQQQNDAEDEDEADEDEDVE